MRTTIVRSAALILLGSFACFAQLSDSERDFALSHLYASEKMFLVSVEGLSPAQLNFRAAPNRWSIAECAEHIALAEDFIFGIVTGQVMKSPAVPDHKASEADDQKVLAATVDRSQKFTAPEPIRPSSKFASVDEAVAHFEKSRARVLDYVRSGQDDLRHHLAENPASGSPIDGYQWILLLSAHTERHVAQIEEVKADPKFPKD
jgi:DinB family protein